jgi:S-adenosylmethionine decarboxylase proenzyme
MDKQQLGMHWLADMYNCSNMPTEPAVLQRILVEAAERSGATVVQSCFHQFSPYGLSGVVVIAESHLAAHTWPEHGTICIDLFSCTQRIDVSIAMQYIQSQVGAGSVEIKSEIRGKRS